jgi:hypothetical protein
MSIITGDGVFRSADFEVLSNTDFGGLNLVNDLASAGTPVVYKGHLNWRPKTANSRMYIRMYDVNDVQLQLRGLMRTSYQNTEISYSTTDSQTFMYITRYNATTDTSFVMASLTFTWACLKRNGKAYPVFTADCNWVYSSSIVMSSHVALIAHNPNSTTLNPRKITFWLADGGRYAEGSTLSMWPHSELDNF